MMYPSSVGETGLAENFEAYWIGQNNQFTLQFFLFYRNTRESWPQTIRLLCIDKKRPLKAGPANNQELLILSVSLKKREPMFRS